MMTRKMKSALMLHLIFSCLISCSSTQTGRPAEANNTPAAAQAREDAPLDVNFCDLLQSPEKYAQKLIRVKALFCSCFERAELFWPGCAVQKSVWVGGSFRKCKDAGRVDEIPYAEHPGRKDTTVGLVAVGKLTGTAGGYGHMNGFDYQFEVECLERAEILDRKGQTRESVMRELRQQVEEFEKSR